MNNSIVELNELNFANEVLGARNPVLVEFWAGWSEPSKDMAQVLETIAGDHDVPVKVGRVSVEQNEVLAENYGVRGVPTLLFFNGGNLRDQIVGRATEQEVRGKIDRLK